jgi:hypothetical protein
MVLVVLTVTVSFGIFEIVRRVPPLRPLFGLKGSRAMARATAPGTTPTSAPAPLPQAAGQAGR